MKKALAAIIGVGMITTACGTSVNHSSDLASASRPASNPSGHFVLLSKIYPSMPTCETGVKMDISTDSISSKGLMATVSNQVVGFCELYVEPDTRSYKLTPRKSMDSCGTVVYAGENREGRILITDLRNWSCPTFAPLEYTIKVEETRNGEIKVLYNQTWDSSNQASLMIEGILREDAAIGGETTGFALMHGGERYEVDFVTYDLIDLAKSLMGKPVIVTGTFKTFLGVEIPSRKVLVVNKIEPSYE